MKPSRQAGFTLIELVIVIVILGILAATALPRFSDLSTDASVAALNGLAGSLRSAAAISRATQLAKGLSSGQGITLDGVAISMSAGYPTAQNMSMALTDTTGFTVVAVGTSVEFRLNNQGQCMVNYRAPTSATSGYTVTVTSTGADPC